VFKTRRSLLPPLQQYIKFLGVCSLRRSQLTRKVLPHGSLIFSSFAREACKSTLC
jgi:hypothetical protein